MDYLILNQKQHDFYRYDLFLNMDDRIFFLELENLKILHDFKIYPCPAYLLKITCLDFQYLVTFIDSLIQDYSVKEFKIVCVQEKFLDTIGLLRDHYKLDGISNSVINKFRNKLLMKKIASEGGILVPLNFSFHKNITYQEIVEKVGRKFVLKPIAGMGSLSTFVVESEMAYNLILNSQNLDNYEFEQFLNGKAGCIDSVVYNGEIHYQFPLMYSLDTLAALSEGIFSTLPLLSSDHNYLKLLKFNELLVKAFDVDYGVLHSEFFIVNNEVVFLESGIRPPGGLNVIVHSLMSSVDFLKIATCFEMNPSLYELKPIVAQFFCLPVIFFSNDNFVPELKLPSFSSRVEKIFKKHKPGDQWIPSINSGCSYASLLLTSENYDDILNDFNSLRIKNSR